jgi:hypothetical protein
MIILKTQSDIKQEYKGLINSLKLGLINPNANINLGFGLIGSDKARLLRIKEELKNFKEDIIFYNKIGFPEID